MGGVQMVCWPPSQKIGGPGPPAPPPALPTPMGYLRGKLQAPMLRYGIFSCVRSFLPFSQKRSNISDFMLFVFAV